MDNSIHIGTSGWFYKHWKENFYPSKLPPKEYLSHYSKYFSTVEVNNSFYHLIKNETIENWLKMVPDDFLFAVKASRYITHIKRLKDAENSITVFMESIKSFNEKLGPILFQLPPNFAFKPERLEGFLKLLPDDYKYSFEFRDKNWFNQETYDILKSHNISLCIYDLSGYQSPKEITADFVYMRFHGSIVLGSGEYREKELEEFCDYIKEIKSKDKEIFCYFNNDTEGFAVKNAVALIQKLPFK